MSFSAWVPSLLRRSRMAAILVAAVSLPALPSAAQEAVCVKVRLEIPQRLTFERDAFDIRLGLTNRLTDAPLEEVRVELTFLDDTGADAAAQFFLAPPFLDGMTGALDGTGTIPPEGLGDIRWLLIPTPGAGGSLPTGETYRVKALLEYSANGSLFSTETTEETFTVQPQPALALDYFLPRRVQADDPFTAEIEPSIPFDLGVRVSNVGAGPARNLQIASAQPRIVENELGAIIDFTLIGTFLDDRTIANTLSIPFGTLYPARCAMGAWAMTTTLEGSFISLDARFTHAEELGGEKTSLLERVTTHWLVHRVLADTAGKDAVPDALVELEDGSGGGPVTFQLLESDCGEVAVTTAAGSSTGAPNAADPTATVDAPVSVGWNYVTTPDLAAGGMPLRTVVRESDGRALHARNFWRESDALGNPVIALFDYAVAGGVEERYLIGYDASDFDATPPISTLTALLPHQDADHLLVSATTVLLITASDDMSGVAKTEMRLDDGPTVLKQPFYFATEGLHTVDFWSTDLKGNVEAEQRRVVQVDASAPGVVDVSPAPGTTLTTNDPVQVAFTLDDLDPAPTSTASLVPDAGGAAVPVVSGQILPAGALSPGTYRLVVDVEDWVENRARVEASAFVIEPYVSSAPSISVTGVADGGIYASAVAPLVEVSGELVEHTRVTLDGAPFLSGTPVTSEGPHLLGAYAIDALGRAAELAITFTLDATSPTVAVSLVEDGGLYTSGVIPLIEVFDENLDGFDARLNDALYDIGTPIDVEGAQLLVVTASDRAGNIETVTVAFTIDLTPPNITVSGVAEGEFYPAPVTPVVTVTDVSDVDTTIRLDAGLLPAGVLVGHGSHLLDVRALDAAGRGSELRVSFVVDTKPPEVRARNVSAGGVYGAGVTPEVEIEDEWLDVSVALLDGVPFVSGAAVEAPGEHTLSVEAKDLAGHETALVLSFTIDPDAPLIVVEGVEDGGRYRGDVVPAFSSPDPQATLSATLDGAPFASGTTVSEAGDHLLVVTAVGATGVEARVEIDFTIDLDAPSVLVTGVIDGGVYALPVQPVVLVRGDDVVSVELELDGEPFTEGTEIAAAGSHQLIVRVRDAAGNETVVVIDFEVDPSAPVIELLGVADGAVVQGPVTLEVVAPLDAEVLLTVNGAAAATGAVLSTEGDYLAMLSATAPSGAIAVTGLRFSVDATPPGIVINGVSEGAFYASAVHPGWLVEDAHLADVVALLDGELFTAGAPIALEGEHELVVSAFDLAGNSASESVRFSLDLTAPVIVITGVEDGGSYAGAVAPVFSVDDAHLDVLEATLNGEAFSSGGVVETAGDYVVAVRAVDLAGNTSTEQRSFTILEGAASLELLVTKQGDPVAGVPVALHPAAGGPAIARGSLDESGRFVFLDLAPGRYRARVDRLWQRHLLPAVDVSGPTRLEHELANEPQYDTSVHINAAAPGGGDGSQEAPFSRLAEAVAAASFGSVVRLAGGVVEGGVAVPDGVTLQGGYDAATWRHEPGVQRTVVVGDGEGPVLLAADLGHAVLSDLIVRGSSPTDAAIVARSSSVLLVDLVIAGNAAALLLEDANDSLVANVLVSDGDAAGAGVAAVRITRSELRLEALTVANNPGGGVLVDGGQVDIAYSIIDGNGGVGIAAEASDVALLDVLLGGNGGGNLAPALDVLVGQSGVAIGRATFVDGPRHAYYLAQRRDGAPLDSAGVDAASTTAATLELSARTTSPSGTPDSGRLDLGFHARSAVGPQLPDISVPEGCGGCSSSEPSAWLVLGLALALAAVGRRRRVRP